jgi:hypothetical protein
LFLPPHGLSGLCGGFFMPKNLLFSSKTQKLYKTGIGDLAIRLLIFLYERGEKQRGQFWKHI